MSVKGNRQMTKTVRLNQKDLERLAKDLEEYEKSFDDKCEEFVKRLIELGYDIASARIVEGASDSDFSRDCKFTKNVTSEGTIIRGVLAITSNPLETKDGRKFYPHLALEFGAGNRYNPTNPPKAGEFGMGAGTFPKQTHVPEPGYWYFNRKRHYGVQATMPMFEASEEMANKIEEVAREVFGNG